jgi:hypothetical protein
MYAQPRQLRGKIVIDGYDAKKRGLIADGDRDLKKIALTQ